MKTFIHIHGIRKEHADSQLWLGLVSLVPDQKDAPQIFGCRLPEGDPRISRILNLLEKAGWEPEARQFHSGGSVAKQFRYGIGRVFDNRDFEGFELMKMRPVKVLDEVCMDWNNDGVLRLDYADLKKHGRSGLAFGLQEELAVSERVRKLIEDAGLRHVAFRPTVLKGESRVTPNGPESENLLPWSDAADHPWWELTSDLTLPAVSGRTALRDAKWGPVKPDFSTGCYLAEVDFTVTDLHYARSDLKKLPEFDVAVTHEHWGPGTDPSARFDWQRIRVVSQRFYRFVRDHNLAANFWPVHIDEDL